MASITNTTPKRALTRSHDWTVQFIAKLSETGIVKEACAAAGVDRTTAYGKRKNDVAFADEWRKALAEAVDVLEAEARRRAWEGVNEPVIHNGKLCGHYVGQDGRPCSETEPGATLIPLTVKKYSDVLLMFLMKGAKPKKWRENVKHEHTGKNGGPIQFDLSKLNEDELRTIRSIHNRLATAGSN